MAEITKVALKVDNNTSFPNNNNGAITPSILRAFNTNMIDSLVDEVGYTLDSGSWNQQIDALEQFTASASGLTNTDCMNPLNEFRSRASSVACSVLHRRAVAIH